MNSRKEKFEKINIKITAIWWMILFVAAMYFMIVTAGRKTIVIADSSYGQETLRESEGASKESYLEVRGTEQGTATILIPLEEGIKPETVVMENCYMDRELHIFVSEAKEEFYEDQSIQGDVSAIISAGFEKQRKGLLLKLHMDGVYEYRTSMKDNMLSVQIFDPRELYRMLVVIDPTGGCTGLAKPGERPDGRELTLEVSRLLPTLLDKDDIRLYFTRTDDVVSDIDKRTALVEELNADLFICLGVGSEDADQYGICGWYNESFVIPEFGNVELADIVTRSVTISGDNRAIGLKTAEEGSILDNIRVPAAGVDLGNMYNEKERGLLSQNVYREKLAQGIADAIQEVYTLLYG